MVNPTSAAGALSARCAPRRSYGPRTHIGPRRDLPPGRMSAGRPIRPVAGSNPTSRAVDREGEVGGVQRAKPSAHVSSNRTVATALHVAQRVSRGPVVAPDDRGLRRRSRRRHTAQRIGVPPRPRRLLIVRSQAPQQISLGWDAYHVCARATEASPLIMRARRAAHSLASQWDGPAADLSPPAAHRGRLRQWSRR